MVLRRSTTVGFQVMAITLAMAMAWGWVSLGGKALRFDHGWSDGRRGAKNGGRFLGHWVMVMVRQMGRRVVMIWFLYMRPMLLPFFLL